MSIHRAIKKCIVRIVHGNYVKIFIQIRSTSSKTNRKKRSKILVERSPIASFFSEVLQMTSEYCLHKRNATSTLYYIQNFFWMVKKEDIQYQFDETS